MESSCIIRHFEQYSQLSETDVALLRKLEDDPRQYRRGEIIFSQGDRTRNFFTVNKGWVYAYRNLDDGSRQVLDVYVPGDIVGLREFAFEQRITGLIALEDAQLCSFPKTQLTDIFARSLMLSTILFTIAAKDQAVLLERLVNLGRRSARQKLAHFLIETHIRLKRSGDHIGDPNHIPLTQVLLADALGLSEVHVNRVIKELKALNLIQSAGTGLRIADIEGLKEEGRFDGHYLASDINDMLERAREAQDKIDVEHAQVTGEVPVDSRASR